MGPCPDTGGPDMPGWRHGSRGAGPAGPLGDLEPSAHPLRPLRSLLPQGPGRVTLAVDSISLGILGNVDDG